MTSGLHDELTKGTKVRIKGERGKFTFVSWWEGDEVVACWDGHKMRYFDAHKVRKIRNQE